MKKIILLPKTDTVILCLPGNWVGVPIVCRLAPIPGCYVNFEEIEMEAEKIITFQNKKRKRRINESNNAEL